MKARSAEGQNVCNKIYGHIRANNNRIIYNDANTGILVQDHVALPAVLADMPMNNVVTEYPRVIPRAPATDRMLIVWGASVIQDELQLTDASQYMVTGAVQVRAVASGLRGEYNFSRLISEILAASFKIGLQRSDASGLFVILNIIEDWIEVGVNLGVPPVITDVAENIQYIDVSAEGEPGRAAANNLIAGTARNAIFLKYKDLSPSDLNVIRIISAGLNKLENPAPNPARPNVPLASLFRGTGLPVVVWNDGPIPDAGAIVLPSAVAVRACARRIADMMDWSQAYVQGYTRSATILNGLLSAEDRNNMRAQRYYTAGFETGNIRLPRPAGHNFMWRILGLEAQTPAHQFFVDEYNIINEIDCQLRAYIRSGIATVYSLGVSAAFHNCNIGGRELNVWANPANGPNNRSICITNDFFRVGGNQTVLAINQVACGMISQVSDVTISWLCFNGDAFCNARGGLFNVGIAQAWQHTWNRRIPYIARPESIGWLLQGWLHLWAITNSGVSFNLRDEIYLAGGIEGDALRIFDGESKYLTAWTGHRPFLWIAYGQLVINVIRQHYRYVAHPRITFRYIRAATSGRAHEMPNNIQIEELQPEWEDEVFTTVPGSIVTYDWELNVVIGPLIRRGNMNADLWEQLIRSGEVHSAWAGYLNDGPIAGFVINDAPIGISDLIWGAGNLNLGDGSSTSNGDQSSVNQAEN